MDFSQRCYELLKSIPKGRVTTYGEIARALDSKAYRAVGSAMAKNTNLITVPCHRVVKSDGLVGEYALGSDKKIALLETEGVTIINKRVANFQEVFYRFS